MSPSRWRERVYNAFYGTKTKWKKPGGGSVFRTFFGLSPIYPHLERDDLLAHVGGDDGVHPARLGHGHESIPSAKAHRHAGGPGRKERIKNDKGGKLMCESTGRERWASSFTAFRRTQPRNKCLWNGEDR